MSTTLTNQTITVTKQTDIDSTVLDSCRILGGIEITNSSYITIQNCTVELTAKMDLSNSANVHMSGCYFNTTDVPYENSIDRMEDWLKEFDEDMYAQWVLWSGR